MSIRKCNKVRTLQTEVKKRKEEKNEVGRLTGHQQEQVLFLFCSAAYSASLSSVKSVVSLAGTTNRDTCGAKDAIEAIEL